MKIMQRKSPAGCPAGLGELLVLFVVQCMRKLDRPAGAGDDGAGGGARDEPSSVRAYRLSPRRCQAAARRRLAVGAALVVGARTRVPSGVDPDRVRVPLIAADVTVWPIARSFCDDLVGRAASARSSPCRAATGGACAARRRPRRTFRPYSVTPSTTVNTVLMIVRPPGDPVTSTTLPSFDHDRRRHRAEHPLARIDQVRRACRCRRRRRVTPGFLLKSPISLFRRKPAPLTTTCEPKPPSSV